MSSDSLAVLSSSSSISREENIDRVNEEEARELQEKRAEMIAARERYVQLSREIEIRRKRKHALENLRHNSTSQAPTLVATPRRKHQPISPETRANIEHNLVANNLMSWDQATVVYGVSRTSIARIVQEAKQKYLDPNYVKPPPKKRGRTSSISAQWVVFLLDLIEKDSTLTLKEMVQSLRNNGVETSKSSLQRLLEKVELTWKTVLEIPTAWNTPEVLLARQNYVFSLMRHQSRNIVYVDESGFNLHVKKSKGRALRGEKAVLTVLPKGQRVSLLAALSTADIVHTKKVLSLGKTKRGVNADDFRLFLADLGRKVSVFGLHCFLEKLLTF